MNGSQPPFEQRLRTQYLSFSGQSLPGYEFAYDKTPRSFFILKTDSKDFVISAEAEFESDTARARSL